MGNTFFSSKPYKSPTVDNFIFRLVYDWTVWKICIFCFVVLCRLLAGDSFGCTTAYDAIPQTFLDTKCYSEPVFSFPTQPRQDQGQFLPPVNHPSRQYMRKLSYYPWVTLVFLVQALSFYMPHFLWKTYESGYIGRLTAGLQVPLSKEQKRSLELSYIAKFLWTTQGRHKVFTFVYLFCETLNLLTSMGMLVWLVKFFDVTGVPDNIPVHISTWSEYRHFYFPPTGMCTITRYSASGEQKTVEAMCILSLNNLYMRMFLILRSWYVFLILITGMVLIYRLALMSPLVRYWVTRVMARMTPKSTVLSICYQLTYSDWLFLASVQKSVTDVDFAKLLEKLLVVSQNADNGQPQDEDMSSIYEDSHKDLSMPPKRTPL